MKEVEQHLKLSNDTTCIPLKYKAIRAAFSIFGWVAPQTTARLAYRLFTRPLSRAKHRVSDILLEQAQVFSIPFKKYSLKAYSWGEGTETILLVHGWESRGTALRSFVPNLVAKGYKVVTFDAPAHGDSEGSWVNMPLYAEAIRTVIQSVGKVQTIIGHSFGGSSSVYLLSCLDTNIAIQNLVLIATPANIEHIFEEFAATIHATPPMRAAFYNHIKKVTGIAIPDYHLEKWGKKMNVTQTLVIHDQEDDVVPFIDGEAYYHNLPNAQIYVTEGYGHFKLVKKQDVITRIGDFLDKKAQVASLLLY
jgi:pimeloyl-ACP methyl ester carboxylesterase